MANCCFVSIDWQFATQEDAVRHATWLEQRNKEAREKNLRMDFGAPERGMENADIQLVGDRRVLLSGCVRWVLELWDFKQAVDAAEHCIYAHAEYEECSCQLYGNYTYEDGVYKEHFVPEDHWPEPDDDLSDSELDEWYDNQGTYMENALEEHGVHHEFTPKEVDKQFEAHVAQWNEIRNRSNAAN